MKSRTILFVLFFISYSLCSFSPIKPELLVNLNNKNNHQDEKRKREKMPSEGDWQLYAESAREIIDANRNLQDALELIDLSIDLQINSVNLELKGDYYTKMGDLNNAFELYQRAITLCVFNIHEKHRLRALQTKAIGISQLLKKNITE